MSDTRIDTYLENGVFTITLNRPEKLNAIDLAMTSALSDAITRVEESRDIRAVILTSTGKSFCVGADIGAFAEQNPVMTWREWVRGGHVLIDRLSALRVPTIGAINGFCFGGGLELALALDFCIAADTAKFAAPEVKIGTVPGWGGSQRLPKLIGPARARQMMYTGTAIDAAKAEAWGLVTETVAPAALMQRANEIAGEIAANAPIAVEVAKQLAEGASGLQLMATLESLAGGFTKSTEDGAEGLAAFLEKRSPDYKGN
ncbi:enoyl-CoA hydratase/isomerase family protein [Falsihalocynthiibacter sp. SS001]|uniref:enoyl-CoA hydratase/isomerase family protein n=1 Tax=Falsihalocynthiibacter sp. SS001 TaxID=3349698 RepID=UPI0036D232AE